MESILAESVQTVTTAYLENGGFNTLMLDWSQLASGLYNIAAGNVKIVGDKVAQVVLGLITAGLPLSNVHVVGHSLGGQMAGLIGKRVQIYSDNQMKLDRISALDPAGPLYWELLGSSALPLFLPEISKNDANFVDVIHSDGGFLGEPNACGYADFWPNGGSRFQPGCPVVTSLISIDDRE